MEAASTSGEPSLHFLLCVRLSILWIHRPSCLLLLVWRRWVAGSLFHNSCVHLPPPSWNNGRCWCVHFRVHFRTAALRHFRSAALRALLSPHLHIDATSHVTRPPFVIFSQCGSSPHHFICIFSFYSSFVHCPLPVISINLHQLVITDSCARSIHIFPARFQGQDVAGVGGFMRSHRDVCHPDAILKDAIFFSPLFCYPFLRWAPFHFNQPTNSTDYANEP